jgi:hypothetical protein
MYDGYLFFCNGETQRQCISSKKYVCAESQNKPSGPIKEGSIIFLFNPEAETLLGPFTALNEGGGELDSGAWKMSVDENIPSEDIKVTWEQLHILRNASQKAPPFKTLKPCKLTSIETQNILDLLAQGEPYIEEKTEA